MTTNLTAEFASAEQVGGAIRALLAAGVRREGIELFSDRPVNLPAGLLDRPGRTSLVAVLGAAVNGGLATAFIHYTQRDYPLVTGGMPLSSPWATGVITFELTMAGAIAGAVLAFLWQSGLLRRQKGAPAGRPEGVIVVCVECPAAAAAPAAEHLLRAGALNVQEREAS